MATSNITGQAPVVKTASGGVHLKVFNLQSCSSYGGFYFMEVFILWRFLFYGGVYLMEVLPYGGIHPMDVFIS